MGRHFTALVGKSPDPEVLVERVGDCLEEYRSTLLEHEKLSYERVEPRDPTPDRVRIEGRGSFEHGLTDALADGRLGAVDWAVVLYGNDERPSDIAFVFRGDEEIDGFVGDHKLAGVDVEAYLERYHGILVDSPTPYTPQEPFVAADALPSDPPEQSLADERPEPPFVVTGEDELE